MDVKNIEKSSHSIEMVTDFVHRLQKMRTKVAETLSDVGYLLNEALLLKQALEENADEDGRKSSEFPDVYDINSTERESGDDNEFISQQYDYSIPIQRYDKNNLETRVRSATTPSPNTSAYLNSNSFSTASMDLKKG